MPHTPLRSVLYVPGDKPRALEKAKTLPVDAVIYDLEDAVAPEAKATARAALAELLTANLAQPLPHLVCVRINHLATPWGAEDLAMLAPLRPAAIALPKVERSDDVDEAARALQGETRIWAMIETPKGVLHVDQVAGASARLQALVMGTSDLVKDLRAQHVQGREPLLYSLSRVVLAARAHDLRVLDGVHLDLNDDEGFAQSCRQGRALGFDGKTLIHPKTIEATNAAFGPTAEDVTWAKRVLAAWTERGDKGVIVLDGQLIEVLHVAEAQRMLHMAEQIAAANISAEV